MKGGCCCVSVCLGTAALLARIMNTAGHVHVGRAVQHAFSSSPWSLLSMP